MGLQKRPHEPEREISERVLQKESEEPRSKRPRVRRKETKVQTPIETNTEQVRDDSFPNLLNTPENFSGGKIADYFDEWKKFTSDQWVLNQVKGVKVNFNTEDTDVRDKNQICFPYNEKLIIQEEIEKFGK